jgi:hypothetical protein
MIPRFLTIHTWPIDSDWMTEILTVTLTDDPGLITDTRIMLTVYDR